MATAKSLKICPRGHRYYKSSNCPTCPVCEANVKPEEAFLTMLYAPARRALVNHGITMIEQLATYTEKEILKLHGMGKASLPALREALKAHGLAFREIEK